MAVYTRVGESDLIALLKDYDIGTLHDFSGIAAGITNTNYFVDTTTGRWVLTLFEQTEAAQHLPFFMAWMAHLARHGVPCAHPVVRRDGQFLSTVCSRPAALVHYLEGQHETMPTPAHCHSLGIVVARMHQASHDFQASRRNTRGLAWLEQARQQLASVLPAEEMTLLQDELAFQRQQATTAYAQLPDGIVHADLFRDNVLFTGEEVSGLIDFYYACRGHLLFDLAIICNDWAHDDQAEHFSRAHWQAFMQGYNSQRHLCASEYQAWPAMLRAAALRFWVSRLLDAHFPAAGADVHIKDPTPYRVLLRAHRQSTPALMPL